MTDGGTDRTRRATQGPEGPDGPSGSPLPGAPDVGNTPDAGNTPDRPEGANPPDGPDRADRAEGHPPDRAGADAGADSGAGPEAPGERPPVPSPPALRWAVRAGLIAIALAFAILASVHRWYADDAFVTFRFGANLAAGEGYVWNPGGPRVDGTPSPGWALVTAVARIVGADPVLLTWTAGLLAGLACLALIQWAGRRVMDFTPPWALCATAVVALTRAFVVGASGALPTRVATALAFAGTLVLVREMRRAPSAVRPWSALLFFAAALLRPDALLLHGAAALALALTADGRPARTAVLRSAAAQAVLMLAAGALHFVAFGSAWPAAWSDPFGSARLNEGLAYLSSYPALTFGALWGPVLLAGLALAAPRLNDLATALLAQALVLCAFIALHGGGGIEFLALDPVLPAFGILVAIALRALLLLRGDPPSGRRRVVIAIVALALCGTQAATNFLPPGGARSPTIEPAGAAYDAARRNVEEGQALAEHLRPQDRLATARTGAIPYITGAWHTAARDWPALQRDRVAVIDLSGAFLFERAPAAPPSTSLAPLGPGAFLHCLRLPLGRRPYFVFGSTLDEPAIRAWAAERGLAHVASWPYAPGRDAEPTLGTR